MNAVADLISPWARIDRIRDAVHGAGYSLCLERPELLLDFRRSPLGKSLRDAHVCVRRATAIAHVMANRQPRVYDDELILGNMTSKRVAANYYPEGASLNIIEDIARLDDRVVPIRLSFSEKTRLVRIGAATLRDSVLYHALVSPSRIGHVWDMMHAERYIVTEQAGVSHQVGNYARVIREGLVSADELAADCLARDATPDGARLDADQRAFYESIRIIASGIRTMAANLADEADRCARAPGLSATRRDELASAALGLRHVPYYPARTFREGLQAAWIVHVAMCLEDYEQGLSFGRLDQALLALYQRDLASGALTHDQAVDITASFQLKCCETAPAYSTRMDHYFSGHDVAQGITLGGVDAAGQDVTNELSGVFLDAYALIGTREPALHVRVHEHTPAWFLDKCVSTLQRTGARPAFFGDASIIRAMRNAGYSEAHARDYAIIGCTELASQGRTYNSADAALSNLPMCLELALNEGRTFAGKRHGSHRPPAPALHSMDDVVAAFRAEVRRSVDDMAQVMGWLEEAGRAHRTTPVNSLITDGCLAKGRDVTWGGAEYDFTSVQAVGLADAGDSLYALNRLVFDERRLTLAEFVDILRADFVGHEVLQTELQHKFKRYGNGDAEVDRWTQVAADAWVDCREQSPQYARRQMDRRLLLDDLRVRLRAPHRRAAERAQGRRAPVERQFAGRRGRPHRPERAAALGVFARSLALVQQPCAERDVRQEHHRWQVRRCEARLAVAHVLCRPARHAAADRRARHSDVEEGTRQPRGLPEPAGARFRILRVLCGPAAGNSGRDHRAHDARVGEGLRDVDDSAGFRDPAFLPTRRPRHPQRRILQGLSAALQLVPEPGIVGTRSRTRTQAPCSASGAAPA